MINTALLLSWGAVYKKISAGETIFREGCEANFYYQLESGSVKWINIDDSGTEFIQTIVVAGECFGEIPLFDKQPYVASAIAETDSVILRLHESSFHQLLTKNPEVLLQFTRLMAKRLRYKFFMSKEVASHRPEQTITGILGHFKKSNLYFCNECNQLKLTRQQLAGLTGLRVETVIRTIRSMHDKGILKIEKGRVFC